MTWIWVLGKPWTSSIFAKPGHARGFLFFSSSIPYDTGPELSVRSKKFHLSPDIKIYQYSAHSIKDEVDATHLRITKNDNASKDKIIWNESLPIRINDATKLIN